MTWHLSDKNNHIIKGNIHQKQSCSNVRINKILFKVLFLLILPLKCWFLKELMMKKHIVNAVYNHQYIYD